jgi:hypothetical protein
LCDDEEGDPRKCSVSLIFRLGDADNEERNANDDCPSMDGSVPGKQINIYRSINLLLRHSSTKKYDNYTWKTTTRTGERKRRLALTDGHRTAGGDRPRHRIAGRDQTAPLWAAEKLTARSHRSARLASATRSNRHQRTTTEQR